MRVGIVESGDGDDHVDEDAKSTFQVVGFLVAKEVTYDDDGEDENDDVERLEVEVHILVDAPPDDDDEGGVEEGGLKCCA